jgi:hypothetical protein
MKQRIVGHYELGHQSVQLVLREGDGGEFYTVPERGKVPRIKVGADYTNWFRVVEVLHHEAMELALVMVGCRFQPAPDNGCDHTGYVFHMTHAQFSEASARTGQFMAAALPDLSRAWTKWGKGK